MRFIDNMTPQEIETLALKGMTAPRTASERGNKAQHSPLPWRLAQDEATILCGDKDDPEIVASTCVNDPAATAIDTQEHNAALIVRAVNHADKLAEALNRLAMASEKAMRLSMAAEDVLVIPRNRAMHALAAYEAAQ